MHEFLIVHVTMETILSSFTSSKCLIGLFVRAIRAYWFIHNICIKKRGELVTAYTTD